MARIGLWPVYPLNTYIYRKLKCKFCIYFALGKFKIHNMTYITPSWIRLLKRTNTLENYGLVLQATCIPRGLIRTSYPCFITSPQATVRSPQSSPLPTIRVDRIELIGHGLRRWFYNCSFQVRISQISLKETSTKCGALRHSVIWNFSLTNVTINIISVNNTGTWR